MLGAQSLTFESVDLHIPEPVIRATTAPLSFRDRVNNFFANQANHFKNTFRFVRARSTTLPASCADYRCSSMYRLAKARSFPDVDTPKALRLGIFQVNSTSDTAWVAPLRRIAVTTYLQVYQALAEWVCSDLCHTNLMTKTATF